MITTRVTRLTVTSGMGADKIKESRKVCDFLFERCGGDIFEDAVLAYLRRLGAQHEQFPHTKRGTSDAMLKAIEAAGA